MSPVVLLLPLAALAFWVYCLVDFSRTDEREMRTYPRQVWLVLLVLTSFFGALAWFFLGRPERPAHR